MDYMQFSLQSWPPTILTLKALATASIKRQSLFLLPMTSSVAMTHVKQHNTSDPVPVQDAALKKSGSFYFCFFGEASCQVKKLGLDHVTVKSHPLSVFINKALLEHSHAY